MTTTGQDFTIYAGDAANVIFTVTVDGTATGTPVDISSVTQITWSAQRSQGSAAVLTKTKIGGSITFVTTGTDGKFQLALANADTTGLTGFYLFLATITDNTGKISTVALGRMDVGVAPVWTYSGDPATSTKDAVRFLIGDILTGDPLLQDAEINYAITLRGTAYGAAAQCLRSLSSQMARQADSTQGELRIGYSSRSRAFAKRAEDYETREAISGGGGAWAGGISLVDKQSRESDTDRVKPQFNLGMTDNSLPVGQGSNELLSGTDEAS